MRSERSRAWCALAFAAGSMLGCSALELPNVETDGFLGDYRRLEALPEDGSARNYLNPGARFDAYDTVLLEPVQIWRGKGTRELSVRDGQRLASRLYGLIYQRLSRDFRMVSYPMPHALRIGVALTGADRASPYLFVVSTVNPSTLPVAEVRALESGTPAGVGAARIEARIRDAVSGEVLMEGIYPALGGDDSPHTVGSWSDVDRSLAIWADQLGLLLCLERKLEGCSASVR